MEYKKNKGSTAISTNNQLLFTKNIIKIGSLGSSWLLTRKTILCFQHIGVLLYIFNKCLKITKLVFLQNDHSSLYIKHAVKSLTLIKSFKLSY